MKSNYETLGKYIREIDERNKADIKENLLGVSTQKIFIESIANTVGTDFTNYKLVKRRQFTYVPDTGRRGERIGIALLEHVDNGMVSPVYTVFEIADLNSLLPEYLMMWFRRPEFDRYARFKSNGSVREIFSWEDMCGVELPVPHIDKQREIVTEYNTILNRIDLNNQLIQKLEETAQAIYKQWFIDFEFPNENGEPYKSAGGEMMESELGDIPAGWEVKKIGDIVETLGGGTPSTDEPEYWDGGEVLWYSPTDVTKRNSVFTIDTEKKITKFGLKKSSAKLFPAYCLLMTSRATIGELTINTKEATTNQGFITVVPKENISVYFLYDWAKTQLDEINNLASGSIFPEISKTDFRNLKLLLPTGTVLKKYNNLISNLFHNIRFKDEESILLEKTRNLLLSKLATLKD